MCPVPAHQPLLTGVDLKEVEEVESFCPCDQTPGPDIGSAVDALILDTADLISAAQTSGRVGLLRQLWPAPLRQRLAHDQSGNC